jgi:hypothetical protein
MLIKLQAGAEVDLATGEELDNVSSKLLGAIERRDNDPRPIYLSRSGAVIGTGAAAIVDVGRPPVGSIWQLRYITIFGNDSFTVVSGLTCSLFCGDPVSPSLAQLKLTGLAAPSATFIPDTCIWCHPTDSVFLTTSIALPAGQQLGANLGIEEWLLRDVSRLSGRG